MSENFNLIIFDSTGLSMGLNDDHENALDDLDVEDRQEIKDASEQFFNPLRKPKNLTQKDVNEFLCEPDPWCQDGNPRCNSGYDDFSIYDD